MLDFVLLHDCIFALCVPNYWIMTFMAHKVCLVAYILALMHFDLRQATKVVKQQWQYTQVFIAQLYHY